MTQSLNLNGNSDVFIDSTGNLSVISGIAAVQQNCETAMKAIQGEMIYALKSGMPYPTVVWNNYNKQLFRSAAIITLSNVQDVVSVTSFTSALNENVLEYTATIKTIYGTVTIS
jgi:hypothetical protein